MSKQHGRVTTVLSNDKQLYGVPTDRGFIDLSSRLGSRWPTLKDALADNALPKLIEAAAGLTEDLGPEQYRNTVPVPNAEKIICVGVNYPDRNEEYKDGQAAPSKPSLFPRFARSFVGHDVPLIRPTESPQLDYEGEIVLVVGKSGRKITEDRALDHIAAVTLCNEGTVRDWVRHAKFNVTQGKNFDASGSIGPWLVPFTDEAQIADIALTTRVNGELRQSDRTGRMIFPFRMLISYISTFTTLVPGDIIVTGTPTGAGARHEPPVWLKPGDVIEVEADGIGVLRNGVTDY